MIFKTWEEAEEDFYTHNDCISDDVDTESARIERWVEDCGHKIEEEYTEKEWADLKREAQRISK